MDKSTELKEFKIEYTKKHLFFLFLGVIVFTIAVLYFIFNADNLAVSCSLNPRRYCFSNPITYYILGWFSVCFFTILGSLSLFKYIKNPLIFIVNEEGIMFPEGFVEWNDILKTTLYNIKGTVFLRVKLRARTAKYLKRNYNMFQKFLASLQEKNTFSYPVSGTSVDINELYDFVRMHIENVHKKY